MPPRLPAPHALLVCLVIAGALVATTTRASAQPGQPLPGTSPGTEIRHQWYGYHIAGVDAGLVLLMLGTERVEPLYAMALSGPMVHLLHKHPWRALASLALRVGLPAPGVLLSQRADCDPDVDDWCGFGEALLALGGGVAAVVLDVALVARHDIEVPARPLVAPTAAISRSGFRLGLVGSF